MEVGANFMRLAGTDGVTLCATSLEKTGTLGSVTYGRKSATTRFKHSIGKRTCSERHVYSLAGWGRKRDVYSEYTRCGRREGLRQDEMVLNFGHGYKLPVAGLLRIALAQSQSDVSDFGRALTNAEKPT